MSVLPVITVTPDGPGSWTVTVAEGGSSTSHRVTASPDEVASLGGGVPAEGLIEESFRFLLEREPRESILSRFELPVIGRYFPDYPQEIRRRMGS